MNKQKELVALAPEELAQVNGGDLSFDDAYKFLFDLGNQVGTVSNGGQTFAGGPGLLSPGILPWVLSQGNAWPQDA